MKTLIIIISTLFLLANPVIAKSQIDSVIAYTGFLNDSTIDGLAMAKEASRQGQLLIAVEASDDQKLIDDVVQVMNESKTAGRDRVAVIIVEKIPEDKNCVILYANGELVGLLKQQPWAEGAGRGGVLRMRVLEEYDQHIKPFVISQR